MERGYDIMFPSTLAIFDTTEHVALSFQEFEIENLKRDSLILYETVQEYFATLTLEQG